MVVTQIEELLDVLARSGATICGEAHAARALEIALGHLASTARRPHPDSLSD